MRAAIIGAVEFNGPHFQSLDFDLVVAVDRGYATCQALGIVPDIVMGDFDSLGYIPQEPKVRLHPQIKDESDMELALRLVHARGYREVYVYGALAARLDHTLANIQIFASFASLGMRIVGVGTNFAVVALSGSSENTNTLCFEAFDQSLLTGAYGPHISVFAVGGRAEGVTEHGLKYKLENSVLTGASSLGLSNEFTGEQASISVKRGTLVVMFALDALAHTSLTE